MILVVDDFQPYRELMRAICESLGLGCCDAADGVEAMDVVRSAVGLKAIVMDVHMPNLDGIAATRLLRQDGCGLPILAVTYDMSLETFAACRAAGANAVLPKPFEMRDFKSLIRRFVGISASVLKEGGDSLNTISND